jgi:hypothetical protein
VVGVADQVVRLPTLLVEAVEAVVFYPEHLQLVPLQHTHLRLVRQELRVLPLYLAQVVLVVALLRLVLLR